MIILSLFAAEAAFAVIHLACAAIRGPGVHPFFDLDQECNIPTWFSSLQLFSVGALVGLFGPGALSRIGIPRSLIYLASAIFVFLSMDEAVQVHERLNRSLESVQALPRVKGDRGMWMFIYGGSTLLLLAIVIPSLRKLWRHHPAALRLAAIGAGMVLVGGVGLELVADQFLREVDEMGRVRPLPGLRQMYVLEVVAEETLEMAGATVILLAVCRLVLPRATPRQVGPAQERAFEPLLR